MERPRRGTGARRQDISKCVIESISAGLYETQWVHTHLGNGTLVSIFIERLPFGAVFWIAPKTRAYRRNDEGDK
jgi:hypothetical protein